MNLTPLGFGIVVAILLVVAVIVVVAENLRDRDDEPAPEPEPYAANLHCATRGHTYRDYHDVWICDSCGDVVRSPLSCCGLHRYETRGQSLTCTVCGHRTELPYDRENGVA